MHPLFRMNMNRVFVGDNGNHQHCACMHHCSSPTADGSLFMCTPIDPLFLALPYLQAAAKVIACEYCIAINVFIRI